MGGFRSLWTIKTQKYDSTLTIIAITRRQYLISIHYQSRAITYTGQVTKRKFLLKAHTCTDFASFSVKTVPNENLEDQDGLFGIWPTLKANNKITVGTHKLLYTKSRVPSLVLNSCNFIGYKTKAEVCAWIISTTLSDPHYGANETLPSPSLELRLWWSQDLNQRIIRMK